MNQTSEKFHFGGLRPLTAIVVACTASVACGSEPDAGLGKVELALTGSSNGTQYALVDAQFDIEGVESATLETGVEQSDELALDLPVGEYTVFLRDGWQLVEVTADGAGPVAASLSSENPAPFTVESGAVTEVRFAFRTGDGSVSFGAGAVSLGIDVTKLVAREVVFSEVMKNPVVLSDAEGEWLELTNTGTESVSLTGCTVARDASQFTIDDPLSIEPGQHLVLANSSAPGFAPAYVYASVTLPNTGAFTLTLTCDGEVLDSVTVNPALVNNVAGASLSLSGDRASALGNDDALAWCNAASSYNGDLGTPGAANPTCL